MPGIAGVIFKSGFNAYREVHASMVAAMKHEPFYTSGMYADERMNVRLGCVARVNSFCDCMPVLNERRDVVLVFSGEDFSRKSISGHPRSGSRGGIRDARYLIRRYEELGDSFLVELNGWFVGALVDLKRERILLFNDRYGMQRLYYYESEEAFFFSSEAKSLLQVVPSLREISLPALAEHLAFDCVLENKSLFNGISVLPGGSCWTFDRTGHSRKGLYYRPETMESKTLAGGDDLAGRLESLFVDILPAYFESDEAIALSLTGGLDTRLMVAGAPNTEGLLAYTFAGDRDTFDVRQSRKVARAAGLTHSVIRLGTDFFEEFPKLTEQTVYMSDGTLGASGTHNLYFNRLARAIAPVRLTGLFGSEVLRQGRILSHAPRVDGVLGRDVLGYMKEAEQRVIAHRQGNPLTAALHRDIPWRGHGTMSIEQSQVTVRSPFMDNDLVEFLYAVPNAARQSKSLQLEVIRRLDAHLGQIVSDHGDAAARNPIALAVARMVLWVLFKADYTYFFEPPKWLLKVEPILDSTRLSRLLFGHQKFEHYGRWFRDVLPEYMADVLLDQRTLERPFFDRNFLRKAVDAHIGGKRDYRNELDKALTLELIIRTLIEGMPKTSAAGYVADRAPVGLA